MSKKRHENLSQGSGDPSRADKNPPAKKAAKPQRPATGIAWHPALRGFLTLLITLHIVAVFSAPWSLMTSDALPPGFMPELDANGQPQPIPLDSPAWQEPKVPRALHKTFNHYLNLLYLNHGYEFFAPDPAGTHVINYQVTKPDGTVIEGRFPDLKEQWPRLLYHRHMMLAEQTQMIAEITGPDSVLQYSNYLIRKHGGHCKMQLRFHGLLSPEEIEAGATIDDPKTYILLGTFDSQNDGKEEIAIPGGLQ